MSTTFKASTKASVVIPSILCTPLLWIEPLFAFNGALLCLINPSMYVNTMTRSVLKVVEPSSQFIYTELAGGWLHFAFTEAVVLRLVDDVRVWRLLCFGMLLSDIAYCHSCAEAVGGWQEWLQIGKWTGEDWVVTITTWPFVLARVAITLGIGFNSGIAEEKKRV